MAGNAATKPEVAAKAAEIERTQGRAAAVAFYTGALVTPVNQTAERAEGGAVGAVYGTVKGAVLGTLEIAAAALGYRPAQERLLKFAKDPVGTIKAKYSQAEGEVARQLAQGDHFRAGLTTGETVGPDAAAVLGGGAAISSRLGRLRAGAGATSEVEAAAAKAAPTGTVVEDAASGDTKVVGGGGIPEPQPPVAETAPTASAPKVAKRQQYMGKTPGKGSKTGREVIERMKSEGRIVEAEDGTLQVRCPGGNCVGLSETDMSHLEDAVKYWNREGFKQGPKSEPVREFMRDPDNYELEPSSTNRSRGARMPDRYREPEPEPAPQPTTQPKPPEEER